MIIEGFFGLIVFTLSTGSEPIINETRMLFDSEARCEEIRYEMSEDFYTSECFPVVCENGECRRIE